MLTLDEETLETLGWGTQKAIEGLAKHLGYKSAYLREYMRQWRKANPDKYKAIYKRRWLTIKANPKLLAKAKAQVAKYRKTAKGKASNQKRCARYYAKNREAILQKRKEKRASKNATGDNTKPPKR